MKAMILAVLGATAALLSYGLDGPRGLAGALLGIAFAAVLAIASHLLLKRVRGVDSRLLAATMLLSMVASFALMIVFVVLVAVFRHDLLVPASLTACGLYLVYRFLEAFEVTRPDAARGASRVGLPRHDGISRGDGPNRNMGTSERTMRISEEGGGR